VQISSVRHKLLYEIQPCSIEELRLVKLQEAVGSWSSLDPVEESDLKKIAVLLIFKQPKLLSRFLLHCHALIFYFILMS
jgi:hypothetical protein